MLEGTGMSRTLKFESAPDYEAPADANSDNVYTVTVMAKAGGETDNGGSHHRSRPTWTNSVR